MPVLSRKTLVGTASFLLLVTVSIAVILFRPHRQTADERLLSPSPLIKELLKPGLPVFVTPEFLPFVKREEKSLVPPKEVSLPVAKDPRSFFSLNRRERYAAVFIGSGPSYIPLIETLSSSPLWTLAEISPWGYLFKPVGSCTPWRVPAPEEYAALVPESSDRARWMILTAGNLAAMKRYAEATSLLDSADAVHRIPSLALLTRASMAASLAHWEEAAELSRQSLRGDDSNTAAREVLIRALIECGRSDEALTQARKLSKTRPDHTGTLFLQARAANAAGYSAEEIATLQRLVEVGRKNGEPVGGTLVYLGQALGKNGERGPAMRAFEEALASPELTEEQRRMVREVRDHISPDGLKPPSGQTNPPVGPKVSPGEGAGG